MCAGAHGRRLLWNVAVVYYFEHCEIICQSVATETAVAERKVVKAVKGKNLVHDGCPF